MVRHGRLGAAHRPTESVPPPVLLENELASQEAELEELVRDNHTLASVDFNMRQDLVAAQQKIDELREYIGSIQTEADIQIRIFSNKIAKAEGDIRVGESTRKELQESHIEEQRLVTSKLELTARIQQATKELDSSHADLNKIPEMHAELDSLRQEHQKLRKMFEYEKGLNIEKVERMKVMEKDLISKAGEVERLRAELLNADKKASVPIPYAGPCMKPDNLYPPAVHGNTTYSDSLGRPHFHAFGGGPVGGMNAYVSSGFAVRPSVIGDQGISAGASGIAVGAPDHDLVASAGAGGVAVGAPMISAGPSSGRVVGGAPVIGGPAGSGAGVAGNPALGRAYGSSRTQR